MQDDIRERYRAARRDYTTAPQRTGRPAAPAGQPSPPPKKSKRFKKKRLYGALIILLISAAGIGWWFFKIRDSGPIPKSIQKSAGFAIYYPSPLPAGYSLDKTSLKLSTQVLFFNLKSANDTISISEQTLPPNLPDFSVLQKYNASFQKIDAPAGQAIIGTDSGSQETVAILETNTTLISARCSRSTPSDVLNKLIQNLSSLHQ